MSSTPSLSKELNRLGDVRRVRVLLLWCRQRRGLHQQQLGKVSVRARWNGHESMEKKKQRSADRDFDMMLGVISIGVDGVDIDIMFLMFGPRC